MAESKFFGRVYRLSIKPANGKVMTFEVENGKPAMDIKFDVTYARGQTAREGTVSILGLSHKTIHEFISLSAMCRGKALSELVHLRLDAGYFSGGGQLVNILDGFIWYATVTSPPQMWLNLKVSEFNPQGGKMIDMPRENTKIPMRRILTNITDSLSAGEGVEFDWEDKTEDQIISKDDELKSIDFGDKNTLSGVISKLNSSLSDKVKFILRTSNSDDTRIIEVHDNNDEKCAKGIVKVDKDNGLLSVTGIDAVNGCITTFLQGGNDDELCHLELDSLLNQEANGRYYIFKKQYVGHFMGQEWYTRYFCSAREDA